MYKKTWCGRAPRPLMLLALHMFHVGKSLENRNEVGMQLCEHDEFNRNRFTYQDDKSTSFYGRGSESCITVKCVKNTCLFRFESTRKKEVWMAKTIYEN